MAIIETIVQVMALISAVVICGVSLGMIDKKYFDALGIAWGLVAILSILIFIYKII